MNLSEKEIFSAIKKYGSARKAAAALNIPKSTFSDAVRRARTHKFTERQVVKPVILKAPKKKGTVKRYILTSCQDSTKLHPFFEVLKVYANYLDAELMVSGYTYNKSLFEEHSKHKVTFQSEVLPYLTNDRVLISEKIAFCGEMNILPTAADPLLGLKTYTGSKWSVIPHAKIRLESVPMMKGDPAKIVMTTGTISKPNYVPKRAGLLAEFHHTYGAVLVEVCADGEFFCRHLMGEDDSGNFYDLDRYVTVDGVTTCNRIAALTYGDIHYEKLCEATAVASLGFSPSLKKNVSTSSLLDTLRPYQQFFHDTIDFRSRNHHSINDPHFRFEMYVNGTESVEQDLRDAANFLHQTRRDWCTSVIIESNHDTALLKWLKTGDYRQDPVNAIFFLENQLAKYVAIRDGDKKHNVFWEAIKRYSPDNANSLVFVSEDTSYKICGDIEAGMHGHLGANGARPSPRSFSKMGTKANTAHTHSCSIFDGVWTAGVMGSLDMGYNKGLSSWSPTHIVTYLNGKRAMLTMSGSGKFYAE
jgi:hypothetical protein